MRRERQTEYAFNTAHYASIFAQAGELDPQFEVLSTWELRLSMSEEAPDDDVARPSPSRSLLAPALLNAIGQYLVALSRRYKDLRAAWGRMAGGKRAEFRLFFFKCCRRPGCARP